VMSTVHDIAIVMGYYVVTGREFNLTSIAVLLTIVGYSINDTIVVYDRVREIEGHHTGKNLEAVINLATNQTLSRTILTSDVAGAMLVGIATGTYSSIYIAGPFAIWTENWLKAREKKALVARTSAPKQGGGAPKVAAGRR